MRPHAYFITLTYDDLHLPVFSGLPNLYKPDLVQWIDRLRRRLPGKVTIFAVGEYGGTLFGSTKAKREIHPHYHVAVFSSVPKVDGVIRSVAESTWYYGHAHVLRLSSGLIDYITGYVSKKLTNDISMVKATGLGLRPEFTYRSRRPAVGDITDQLVDIYEQYGEVTQINIDGKLVNLPKYLRHKLRDFFLKWNLDLKTSAGKAEYERRKSEKKIETLSLLRQKEDAQKAEIDSRSMVGDVYKKQAQIRAQLIANFETRIKRNTKGMKIL